MVLMDQCVTLLLTLNILILTVPPNTSYSFPTKPRYTVIVYVIGGKAMFCQQENPFTYEVEGENYFDLQRNPLIENHELILFEDGEQITVSTKDEAVRFLFLSGKPIKEPIAWYGPIVMNTQEELQIAFEEYNNGTFLKHRQI